MHGDEELRRVLAVLDEEEAAPPELVERVWANVESLLRGEPSPVPVTRLDDRTHLRNRTNRRRILLVAAAAVLVVGLAGTALVRSTVDDRGAAEPSTDSLPAVTGSTSAGSSPSTSVAGSPETITLAGACATFRAAVGGANPLALPQAPELPATAAIETWVDELGTLLATFEQLEDPIESPQIIALQLMRTSLRSALDDIADADAATARIALTNAARRLDATPPDCLLATDE